MITEDIVLAKMYWKNYLEGVFNIPNIRKEVYLIF